MTIGSRNKIVGIIDYGAGNIGSVANATRFLGYTPRIIDMPEKLDDVPKVIFPGVGAFGSVMSRLKSNEMDRAITDLILEGKHFFGICLGYQVLFDESEESRTPTLSNPGSEKGLGIFEGRVVKFRSGKVPQIGWNEVVPINGSSLISREFYYFVNSYYPIPVNESIVSAKTQYQDVAFASAIKSENVFATQFHPEKSGVPGLRLLKRWLEQC